MGWLAALMAIAGACGPETVGEAVASPPAAAVVPGQLDPGSSTSVPPASSEPLPAGLPDRGIFADLDPRVTLRVASWLKPRAPKLYVDPAAWLATLYFDGLPVKAYPLTRPLEPAPAAATAASSPAVPRSSTAISAPPSPEGPLTLEALPLRPADRMELEHLAGEALTLARATRGAHPHGDTDRDGIPDPLDTLIGAHKTALNGATYRETYEVLKYPGGDVGRDHGVCTDVIIRALRNAGIDLQQEVYRDMKALPKRYRLSGERPDRNIDHRRVRRLLPWFSARYRALPTVFDPDATGVDAWLPGDIVFMDTFPSRSGPDHIGIVSDRLGSDGQPLIINNWTDGYRTQEMELLGFVPVTHRFRPGVRSR